MRELSCRALNPVVRGANYFTMKSLSFGPRYNYGYQSLYVFRGRGFAEINGNIYELGPGSFFLYGPGDCHSFHGTGPGEMTVATNYFSLLDVGEEKLGNLNRSSRRADDNYWSRADERSRITGFPDIPFFLDVPVSRRPVIESVMRELGNNFSHIGAAGELHCKSLLIELFYQLSIIYSSKESGSISNFIRDFTCYMEKNYSRVTLSRSLAAKRLNVSGSYLSVLLRKELNTNFTEYLFNLRMSKALELVLYSHLRMKEICVMTGFSDVSYFVFRYRKRFGKTPGQMRRGG